METSIAVEKGRRLAAKFDKLEKRVDVGRGESETYAMVSYSAIREDRTGHGDG